MSGIIVGVDGSANARYALQWAVKEAAAKHEPLTVVTVNEVAASFWTHQPITVPADQALLEKARQSATDLVDKTLSELGGPVPASVTVRATASPSTNSSTRRGKLTWSWSEHEAALRAAA